MSHGGPPLYRCAGCGCPVVDHAVDDEERRECTQCECRQYLAGPIPPSILGGDAKWDRATACQATEEFKAVFTPSERTWDRLMPTVNWILSSSADPRALAIVDGTGRHAAHGPHYSRRTPGSRTFTGVGQEIVLITEDDCAVWACVRQRTPSARGTGASRGRSGETDRATRYIWRNMLFRNLGPELSSNLIRSALARTYEEWIKRYGALPPERLRTEIGIRATRSKNPGYCYKVAGWVKDRVVRDKLYLWAPGAPELPAAAERTMREAVS